LKIKKRRRFIVLAQHPCPFRPRDREGTVRYSRANRKRNELAITDTELKLIAPAPKAAISELDRSLKG
jgi:hypothetical protein